MVLLNEESRVEILYQITLPYACFGIDVIDNIVIEAPPIAKWMIGNSIGGVCLWVSKKNGTIKEVRKDNV